MPSISADPTMARPITYSQISSATTLPRTATIWEYVDDVVRYQPQSEGPHEDQQGAQRRHRGSASATARRARIP